MLDLGGSSHPIPIPMTCKWFKMISFLSCRELSAQCIVFKKHYVELEATLEAHPLAGILFSQEVISDHELQEIHGATTPFRKNELLLKYLLKSEKDVIPLILDTLKKEPAMEFQHTLIENGKDVILNNGL